MALRGFVSVPPRPKMLLLADFELLDKLLPLLRKFRELDTRLYSSNPQKPGNGLMKDQPSKLALLDLAP